MSLINNISAAHLKYLNLLIDKFKLRKYLQPQLNINILEIVETAVFMMIEYVDEYILKVIHEDLFEPSLEYVYDILCVQYIDTDVLKTLYNLTNEKCKSILQRCCLIARSFVFKFVIPKRSYTKSYIRKNLDDKSYNLNINYEKISKILEKLKAIKQPEQRSDEWYVFRNSTLTASNIWKIFISEYTQTQLILEKCEPLNINKFKTTNTNSPLHWGQKYEPVSILYYEYINNTTVTEFGCIPHNKYSFIAASPDGIVCDQTSELYGRMLEIKNVVSREITGIPKMEYWIQMQMQMEVCDLNECDFLETKFVEYNNEEDYINDKEFQYKGTFLQFLKNEEPYYIYAPFILQDTASEEYITWLNEQMNTYRNLEFIKTIYWKLEVISNILVMRNRIWFNEIVLLIEQFWNNLIEERESGAYKDRIKKKRKLAIEDSKSKSDFPVSGCLINTNSFADKI